MHANFKMASACGSGRSGKQINSGRKKIFEKFGTEGERIFEKYLDEKGYFKDI